MEESKGCGTEEETYGLMQLYLPLSMTGLPGIKEIKKGGIVDIYVGCYYKILSACGGRDSETTCLVEKRKKKKSPGSEGLAKDNVCISVCVYVCVCCCKVAQWIKKKKKCEVDVLQPCITFTVSSL